MRKVVVVGQGYVGLPLALRAVTAGYCVVGYDSDPARVERLASGDSDHLGVPAPEMAASMATGRYTVTADHSACVGFDVALVTVPTPLTEGVPDLTFVRQAATDLGAHVRPGVIVVLESTTYPGTTEGIFAKILEERSGLAAGADFHVGFSPERIDIGNEKWQFWNTPKVVSGVDSRSRDAIAAFYSTLVQAVVPVSRPSVAELSKLIENTFRHVNIALVNELAMFAHELGIDIWEALDAASTKPFGYMRFDPGPGVGGHCLPIDPAYLSWKVRQSLGRSFRFVELAIDINDHMPDYVVGRVVTGLNSRQKTVHGARILVLGLAYKANIGDYREAPAIRIIELLTQLGASVRVADPHVSDSIQPSGALRVSATDDEVRAADAVIVVTDHEAFNLDNLLRGASYALDCRNRVRADNVEIL